MRSSLILCSTVLAVAGCCNSHTRPTPADPNTPVAVVDIIKGVQLAIAHNNPTAWECEKNQKVCADAKDWCAIGTAKASDACSEAIKLAKASCAALTGETASVRCTRELAEADAACGAADQERVRLCAPYLAQRPPKIKRVSLSLQTSTTDIAGGKLSLTFAPISISAGTTSDHLAKRTMHIEFVAAPMLPVGKPTTQQQMDAIGKLFQLRPLPNSTSAITSADRAALDLLGQPKVAFDTTADDISSKLATALTSAAAAASLEPIVDKNGIPHSPPLQMKAVTYAYELQVVLEGKAVVGIALTPISFEIGDSNRREAANIVEMELTR